MIKFLNTEELERVPQKYCVVAEPGSGKSRLITSLPWGSKQFGEKAVYVPLDAKERGLAAVLEENRAHLLCAPPMPDTSGRLNVYQHIHDVLDETASQAWRAEHPEVGTVILDTMTNAMLDILRAISASGMYHKPFSYGDKSKVYMTDKGDYGACHNIVKDYVRKIKEHPLTVICAFWAGWAEPKDGEPGGIYGGPVPVNMNMDLSKFVAGEFGNVFFLRKSTQGGKVEYLAHTEGWAFWTAKLHSNKPVNPISVVKLEPNPRHFWEKVVEVQG